METVVGQTRENITESENTAVIIGSGLAGLAAAVRLKTEVPEFEVVVLEKSPPQSNSYIAGQRFRAGIAGHRHNPEQEIEYLLASRNGGTSTPEMITFSSIAREALEYWHHYPGFTIYQDNTEWFGPQWGIANKNGQGRGKTVLNWFRTKANELGIQFVEGAALNLIMDNEHTDCVIVQTKYGIRAIAASNYILANGNPGGRLFKSTNRRIVLSASELIFEAGLDLVGSTEHMVHPFGNCDQHGNQRLGCFETDQIADVQVYLDGTSDNPKFDPDTTTMLKEHGAHYHFPEIAERFREFGSIVMLEFSDGQHKFARVSHHQTQIGANTYDGVSVTGTDNLYAIGDASSIGYWTNHKERFPGFALLKCLVDAKIITEKLSSKDRKSPVFIGQISQIGETEHSANKTEEAEVVNINTAYMHNWLATPATCTRTRGKYGREWGEMLCDKTAGLPHETLYSLSKAIAKAHEHVGLHPNCEPYTINKNSTEVA